MQWGAYVYPRLRNSITLEEPRDLSPGSCLYPLLCKHGYKEAHKTQELTLHCMKKSLTAFTLLVAFTTFVLSLWLTENEDDCLDAVFTLLAERKADALPR